MVPRISIVTPSFNQSRYLKHTIESVLNQEYPNLEYIIMDGGSSDGSVDIIKSYEKNLAYWESKPDKGMYDAIQKGFDKTTGDIMAWINSDDMYIRGAFSVIAEIFSQFPEIQWLIGGYCSIDESNRIVRTDRPIRWSKYNYQLQDFHFIQQEAVFWRRSLWEKAGACLTANYALAGDFELWLRFFKYAKLYSVSTPLGAFRFRLINQKSFNQYPEYMVEVAEILKKTSITVEEKRVLRKIQFYQNLLKLPFMCNSNRIKWKYEQLFDYPPHIKFDRYKMAFTLNKWHF